MTPERVQQIETLYHAALERAPAERAAFLNRACNDDSGLRGEVESLLEQNAFQDGPLDRPAFAGMDSLLATGGLRLTPGTQLGPYKIEGPLGQGSMGVVYRARDPRLNRDVAIKVSAAHFSERFEREARAIAALNHTNICHLYDVGPDYLVMEYVEGQDLRGPMDFEDALPIIQQLIDGIEAAHEKNIIHRDLKPANIKITPEGVVKILDFGLAKAMEPPPSHDGKPENSPTLTTGATVAGTILGTAAYMAPEQAKGEAADRRSDIWSFGVIVYEMLTGKRLFQGESTVEILGGVLNKKPDISAAPDRIHKLLSWCLEKDRKQRLASISDARRLLVEVIAAAHAAASPSRLGFATGIAAGLFLLTMLVLSLVHFREQPAYRPLVQLDVALGADVALPPPQLLGISIAISPDGTRLVYVSGSPARLFTRRLDQPKATELPGTQGALGSFFSPDGKWIGFGTASKLNKIAVEGGAVVSLADLSYFRGASWGEDGNIVVADELKGLVRVPAAGGPAEIVAELASGETGLASPQILPGGKAILFVAAGSSSKSIQVMTLADRHRKTVVQVGTSPRYLATPNGAGYLAYTNQATLFAVPFDLDKLETRGTGAPILDGVAHNPGGFNLAELDFSRTGTLVYRRSGAKTGGYIVKWIEGGGRTEPLIAKPGAYQRPILSPDGQRLALLLGGDIWIYDWPRDTMTRLTFTGASINAWSPDGRYIVFSEPGVGMFWIRSDGAGKPQPLTQSKDGQSPSSFTPDGKQMAFDGNYAKTGFDIWTVPIESDGSGLRAGKPEIFLQTPANERSAALSPDGHWLAYASDESGAYQIYVRAFPDTGGKWQISTSGGTFPPMWSRTSHELFFETIDTHQIMVAAYTVKGDSFVADKPRLWSETKLADIGGLRNVGIAPDGKRFVAFMPAEGPEAQQAQNQVVFLMNFFDELRRRVPNGK